MVIIIYYLVSRWREREEEGEFASDPINQLGINPENMLSLSLSRSLLVSNSKLPSNTLLTCLRLTRQRLNHLKDELIKEVDRYCLTL